MPLEVCAASRRGNAPLLPRNFRALDHFGPAFDVAVEERCQLLWRAALRDKREIREALLHIRQREDARDFAIEFGDDFFGCLCRNREAIPRRCTTRFRGRR